MQGSTTPGSRFFPLTSHHYFSVKCPCTLTPEWFGTWLHLSLPMPCWPSADQGRQVSKRSPRAWVNPWGCPTPLSSLSGPDSNVSNRGHLGTIVRTTVLQQCQASCASAEGFSCQLSASGSIALGNFSQQVFPKRGKITLLLLFVVS